MSRKYSFLLKAKKDSEFGVTVGGRHLDVEIIDPKRLRRAGDNHDHMDGRAEIKTAMPGKVVRILVESEPRSRRATASSWSRR